jgi:hypothetical protein
MKKTRRGKGRNGTPVSRAGAVAEFLQRWRWRESREGGWEEEQTDASRLNRQTRVDSACSPVRPPLQTASLRIFFIFFCRPDVRHPRTWHSTCARRRAVSTALASVFWCISAFVHLFLSPSHTCLSLCLSLPLSLSPTWPGNTPPVVPMQDWKHSSNPSTPPPPLCPRSSPQPRVKCGWDRVGTWRPCAHCQGPSKGRLHAQARYPRPHGAAPRGRKT